MRIIVEGLMGVGKSTFTKEVTEVFEGLIAPVYESVEDNPFLERYYKEPKRWAYTLQKYFLYDRYKKHLLNHVVLDRSLFGDLGFAKIQLDEGYMDQEEFDSYLDHFKVLRSLLPDIDYCIHLSITPEKALERIALRGRGYENQVPLSYLQKLDVQINQIRDVLPTNTKYIKIEWEDKNEEERKKEIVKLFKTHIF